MWKRVHNGLTQFYGFGSLTCFSCYGMTDDHKELVYESLVCDSCLVHSDEFSLRRTVVF